MMRSSQLTWISILYLLLLTIVQGGKKKTWRGTVGAQSPQLMNIISLYPQCSQSVADLTLHQTALCVKGYDDHIWASNWGLKMAKAECEKQFSMNKWNCSTIKLESMLDGQGKDIGTREDSFVHSIAYAGISHAVARGCTAGNMTKCGCGVQERPKDINLQWHWGGCGDNIRYGHEYSRYFSTLRYQEESYPVKSKGLGVLLTNKHNDEAGLAAVRNTERIECRCAGNSASCAIRVCWQQLGDFEVAGKFLKQRYDDALKVTLNKQGTKLRRAPRQPGGKGKILPTTMLYMDSSPSYCEQKTTLSHGTMGRECNATSLYADSCSTLCCGRGYSSKEVSETYDCNCKFQWCCEIKCHKCRREVMKHYCN